MKLSPIVVLGADGYLGWPLSLRLALKFPERTIILVDSFLRRRLVEEVGGRSIFPILEMKKRLDKCRQLYGLSNLEFFEMDVNSEALSRLIQEKKPAVVYHLAQQCSASYSMASCGKSLFTLRNNEEGNLRLLWAVREYVPECHVIKLGSFGEYAKGGLDIAEGYFRPEYKGQVSSLPIPFPRQADDIYHVSKINDTNYISTACRAWGLRVTDIMQSTVFGTWTEDIGEHEELYTRVDYDEYFGTVANRFMAQALRGLPLMVYGSGHQRTGLMALSDSISSLANLAESQSAPGSHRVINHVTERSFSINELAESIREIARSEGFIIGIERGIHDPRGEQPTEKMPYEIECNYVSENVKQSDMVEVVRQSFRMLMPYRQRIDTGLFPPRTRWCSQVQESGREEISVVVPILTSRIKRNQEKEEYWEDFLDEHFPYKPINLNSGMLGSPSTDVRNAVNHFQSGDLLSEPLQQYQNGRDAYHRARTEAEVLWPTEQHNLQLVGGASQTSNLLALALTRGVSALGRPLRILTTVSEHVGGLGAFERLPEFQLCYLSERELRHLDDFKALVAGFKPDVGFFSQIAYDTGHRLPVAAWAEVLKSQPHEVWSIVDVSQALGVSPPVFENVDVVFGSGHKWLFGPRGTGLLWTNRAFRDHVGALNWSGEPLSPLAIDRGFSPSGGLDFSLYAGLEACFQLYGKVGAQRVHERSMALASFLRVRLTNLLKSHGIRFKLLEPHHGALGDTGMFTISFLNFDPYPLYDALNKNKIYCKCIKNRRKDGVERQLLRFGVPYYETERRLRKALTIIEDCLRQVCVISHSRRGHRLEDGVVPQATYENL